MPKQNQLSAASRFEIVELAENTTPLDRRFAALEADLPLMAAAVRGDAIVIDLRLWVNKSSGRTDYSIGVRDWNADKSPRFMRPIAEGMTFSRGDVGETASKLVSWANPVADEEFYESIRDDLYDEYLNEHGTWDNEEGRMFDAVGIFDEWLANKARFVEQVTYPYEDSGEIQSYRLELIPDELGRSFPLLYRYLHELTEDEFDIYF